MTFPKTGIMLLPLSRVRARAPIAAKVGTGPPSTLWLIGSCGGIAGFRLLRRGFVLRAAARLRLAPPEVFPQRRTQPRLAGGLGAGLGGVGHAGRLGEAVP